MILASTLTITTGLLAVAWRLGGIATAVESLSNRVERLENQLWHADRR